MKSSAINDEDPPARRRTQRKRAPRVLLRDVATQASCSTATVSRTLNEPDRVKPEIRRRVLVAMEKLGYMPNSAARALRSQRTRMMGIVLPTLNHAMYARLVESLQRRLTGHGYSLVVATHEYDLDVELDRVRLMVERGTEGIVLIGDRHDEDLYGLLERSEIPFVNTYVYGPFHQHPCIGFDNSRATSEITEFLLGLGHQHFGMISAITEGNDRATERVAGVRTTLSAHGLTLRPEAVYERPYSIASGREGIRHLCSLDPQPTAIICGNDVLAMGALAECRTLGIKVPDIMSIVGIDNLEFAAHLDPPLTTMEVPAVEMGERAADFLLDRILNKPTAQKIHIESKLIVRKTTGLAPSHSAPIARL